MTSKDGGAGMMTKTAQSVLLGVMRMFWNQSGDGCTPCEYAKLTELRGVNIGASEPKFSQQKDHYYHVSKW